MISPLELAFGGVSAAASYQHRPGSSDKLNRCGYCDYLVSLRKTFSISERGPAGGSARSHVSASDRRQDRQLFGGIAQAQRAGREREPQDLRTEDARQAGALEIVLQAFEPAPWAVSLIYPGQGPLPLKLRAFLNFAVPRPRARLT
jgi:hypothetical protein